MHLDATLGPVVADHVLEAVEVEIGPELAVDAGQQVEIERRGHARRIVVGDEQALLGLLEVGGEQQVVAGEQELAHLPQELVRGRPVEVPDRASQEQHEQALAGGAARGHLAQAVQVLALEPDDAHRIEAIELALGLDQGRARDVDRVVGGELPAPQRLEDPARVLRAAAPQLGDQDRGPEGANDLLRVVAQDAGAGAREAVLGKEADHLEERGPDRVVEVLRGQLLLLRLLQSRPDVGGELRDGVFERGLRQHQHRVSSRNRGAPGRGPGAPRSSDGRSVLDTAE